MKAGIVIAGALVAAGLAGGAWLARGALFGGAQPDQQRIFASPERRTIAASVLATGILRLRVGGEVRVGSQVSGIVEKLNVEVGSKVNRGDVIAKIDSRGLEARLAQAARPGRRGRAGGAARRGRAQAREAARREEAGGREPGGRRGARARRRESEAREGAPRRGRRRDGSHLRRDPFARSPGPWPR